MNVAFVINSQIRRVNRARNLIIEFEKVWRKGTVNSYYTEFAGHAIELSRKLSQNNDIIVAVGGDGTVNEVSNGILLSEKDTALACLPFGTANDFARTLNVSNRFNDFYDLISGGNFTLVDIGEVSYLNVKAENSVRYFVNEIDFGIGGHVVEQVAKSNKTLGARYSFLRAILQSLVIYEQSEVVIKSNEISWSGKLLSLALLNGKFLGGGLKVAAEASITDGWFDVALFSNIKTIHYFRFINKLRRGKKINNPNIHYFRTSELSIEPVDLSCAIDMDGEFVGFTPATVRVIPKKLRILSVVN